ncbi:tetratricopeptide repeat protein [Rhodovulum bhavnagarense]|uniref:Tetratricopeptide repeat protein n=1 Tax=Rhodovulum bhavnagarense TaxID=992286 RepID=A0A4R2RJQ6_9RHOB|nr:tetratricopeptide repeat protein [Rhodovulum bhavnagarense]TCP62759.1 tetratricopeptide repeat protein [Rhodovulum bhavnagarense]
MAAIFPRLSGGVALGLALVLVTPTARAQDGAAGAYLAARHASLQSDYRAAATYYDRALVNDPTNIRLMDNALMAHVGLGEIDAAIPLARRLESAGARSQLATLVLIADQMKRADYAAALADLEAGRNAGPLVSGLIEAWARFGQGRMSDALDRFDSAAQATGLRSFGLYHKALALAAVGDFEGADAIFSGDAGGPLRATRRGVLAHAQVLSQLERNADAIELVENVFGPEADPGVADLLSRLREGLALSFDTINGAAQGAAEVFYTVASALEGDAMDSYTLVYARLAEYLAPDQSDFKLLSAALLEAQGRDELAIAAYAEVPRDDPAFYAAELGRAGALRQAGDTETAIEVLQGLSRIYPDMAVVHMTLGDTLRGQERYKDALAAYDRAIAALGEAEQAHWVAYYARGVSHERLDMWAKAEADLRKALELEPGQPQVLNYLGYSFVEMKSNLDEALAMIERAAAARPDDGYIVDSLGWVLYRLGRYDEAVEPMERAAALMPLDPVVNDHLGDVLWAVGRRLEAEFQWRRALSFGPEDDEAERIRRKLEIGLDKVLQQEGAQPLERRQ